ncbi:MAG: cellulase family glycosylhydrolase [Clostridia bacterium]|nr:cellulase family glycosylhydrolase [Clostridia bacterium]
MEKIFVRGPRFLDEKGRERIFNGVNFVYKGCRPGEDGVIHYQTDLNGELLDRLVARGINLLRLGVTWAGIEPECGKYNTVYLDEVKEVLRLCESRGVYVYLDWHQDLFSCYCSVDGDGAPKWACPRSKKPRPHYIIWAEAYVFGTAVRHAFDDFWNNVPVNGRGLRDRFCDMLQYTVRYFSEFSCIMGYDVFNEPFPGSDGPKLFRNIVANAAATILLSKRVDKKFLLERIRQFDVMGALSVADDPIVYHGVIDRAAKRLNRFDVGVYYDFLCAAGAAIRKAGGEGVLFMENSYFSNLGIPCLTPNVVYADGTPETQLAFAPHGYDITVDTPLTNTASTNRVSFIFNEHKNKQQRQNLPVVVGEWGGMVPGSDEYPALEFLISLFDQNRWSQTYWHYHEGFADNGIMKVLSRPYPQSVAGEIRSYGYDRQRKEFHLSYFGSPDIKAPTLIYLPQKPTKIYSTKKYILKPVGDACLLQVYAGKGHCCVTAEFDG